MGLVNEDVLGAVARRVFGADASVLSSSLLAEGTGNLAHLLTLRGHDRRYVFRFNRGLREDTYDTEVATDKPIAEATGVWVPEIFAIDRSCAEAPTAYMVMEYLTGEDWVELCRPDNTHTTPREKREIRAATGRFYADLHAVTRPASPEESISTILLRLSQLAGAADAGMPVDDEALARLGLYSQLSLWAIIAAENAPAEKKQWIREQKLPVINQLIDRIASL